MGSPYSAANASTSSGALTGFGVPGTSGAPAAVAMCRASTLSPSLRMASGLGPTQIRPASCTAAAKWAFSDRKP